jgi:hypothetical protein
MVILPPNFTGGVGEAKKISVMENNIETILTMAKLIQLLCSWIIPSSRFYLNTSFACWILSRLQSQSHITTDSQSAVGVRHPSGTSDQFFFLVEIFFLFPLLHIIVSAGTYLPSRCLETKGGTHFTVTLSTRDPRDT